MKLEEIAEFISALREHPKVGYTAGVFDLFHHGHVNYLAACKCKCQILVVGVDSDELVRFRKGNSRPFNNIDVRLKNVLSTGFVYYAFKKTNSAEEIIPIVCPSVYFIPSNRALSPDRIQLLQKHNVIVEILNYTQGISTSLLAK